MGLIGLLGDQAWHGRDLLSNSLACFFFTYFSAFSSFCTFPSKFDVFGGGGCRDHVPTPGRRARSSQMVMSVDLGRRLVLPFYATHTYALCLNIGKNCFNSAFMEEKML